VTKALTNPLYQQPQSPTRIDGMSRISQVGGTDLSSDPCRTLRLLIQWIRESLEVGASGWSHCDADLLPIHCINNLRVRHGSTACQESLKWEEPTYQDKRPRSRRVLVLFPFWDWVWIVAFCLDRSVPPT
jgi:hypothetical protein